MGLFDVTDEEVRQLKTIVTKEEAAERHRERNRKQMDRASYLETAEQRRAQARLLRAKGLSIRQIAKEMGLPFPTVQYYLD
jgi:DNA-directed RNA polymerase specialized sigma24 family protein